MAKKDARDRLAVTVELVVLTVRDDALRVLALRRNKAPFKGRWALPRGFLDPDENLDRAAQRGLADEAGLSPGVVHLEQLASYGAPNRSPRARVVAVAYLALAPDLPAPRSARASAAAVWLEASALSGSEDSLAFDHSVILRDGVERARAKLEYTPLAAAFCPPEFTVADLRHVYEVVWNTPLDPRNFHRKVTGTGGFLMPLHRTRTESGRPAALFKVGDARLLHPPMLRKSINSRS
jgi:8-oxo-dGTP diphosphatase